MTKIELVAGQTWLPAARIGVALPRQIKPFTDATGARWVSWRYPGFSNIGGSMPVRSFRRWIRRTGATIAALVDPGAAEAAAFRRGVEAMRKEPPTLTGIAKGLAQIMADIRLLPEEEFPRRSHAESMMNVAEDAVIDALDSVNAAVAALPPPEDKP